MKKKVMEGMEYMEQKYIDEAVASKPRVLSYKPLMRWGAIAACLVLVVGLCLGFLGGSEEIVLPPNRYGEGNMNASLARSYTIGEALEAADVIAWVRVGNWLGERATPLACTFFEAEVVQCYKGNIPENFVLKQLGSSLYTFRGYPLFTNGNEMLLFLKYADLDIDNEEYDDCFMIMGTYSTVMDVTKDEEGNVYVSDRLGMLGASVAEDYPAVKNHKSDAVLRNELVAICEANDAIQSEKVENSKYVFLMEELDDILTGSMTGVQNE